MKSYRPQNFSVRLPFTEGARPLSNWGEIHPTSLENRQERGPFGGKLGLWGPTQAHCKVACTGLLRDVSDHRPLWGGQGLTRPSWGPSLSQAGPADTYRESYIWLALSVLSTPGQELLESRKEQDCRNQAPGTREGQERLIVPKWICHTADVPRVLENCVRSNRAEVQ